ncbi:MAG: hypothetical protein ACD_39C00750G0004 [uncultured bacterium]|nr:MAG: hypothetical protein ACD_39C00750G0004 [uncultured bacterium]
MIKPTGKARAVRLFCVILLVFLCGSPAFIRAAEYKVGPYLVDVDVRTSLMQVIPHAYVKCHLSGKTIRISASAPGYVAKNHELTVKTGVSNYSTVIRLSDPKKRLDVMTFDYKPIVSAYFDRYQGGIPSHLYAINLLLPVKSWPHPSPENVIVNQPGYGWPIQNSCEISVMEDFYKVRMLIDRAVLDDPHDELLVYVNTAEVISVSAAEKWLAKLVELEAEDKQRAAQIAAVLAPFFPAHIDAGYLPDVIARAVALKRRFNELHQE